MTRFARAKGSKASNEKLPERASSWSEMKQELLNKNKEILEKKDREEFLKKRQANYQAFLQEVEEKEKKTVWADFTEAKTTRDERFPNKMRQAPSKRDSFTGIKTKNKISQLDESDESEDSDGQFSALKLQVDKVLADQNNSLNSNNQPAENAKIKDRLNKSKSPKQKLKLVLDKEKQFSKTPGSSSKKSKQELESDLPKNKLVDKKKRKKARNTEPEIIKSHDESSSNASQAVVATQESDNLEKSILDKKLERRKKQKEKMKLKRKLNDELIKSTKEEDLSEEALRQIQKKKEKAARQAEKRRKFREAKALAAGKVDNNENISNKNIPFEKNENGNENNNITNIMKQRHMPNQTKKKPKPKDNKEHARRKTKPEKMFINGKTIEIDYVDGFPVKKEDADRLKKLRKQMISKGLPRSEINIALKLERRRAEKAFAREKKNVCFNCRKSGHNLSECPELSKDQVTEQTGTGICFKCGSTEHTHFECKVVKGLDYKFANCFICKEQGHIARQCPDNQRGLYPKGGSCKVCGDVTHLKKDCPKFQAQQSQLQSSLSIGTLSNGNPDDLDMKGIPAKLYSGTGNKLNKVIKF